MYSQKLIFTEWGTYIIVLQPKLKGPQHYKFYFVSNTILGVLKSDLFQAEQNFLNYIII